MIVLAGLNGLETTMTATAEQLTRKHCVSCEGGVPRLSDAAAQAMVQDLPGWKLTADRQRIRKEWTVRNFLAGVDFFNRIANLAEEEGHHPDLHLEGYRNVAVEIWTHAISGLSENDFILAAKIDELPVEIKRK
jgi:4a-hydroxytetrahydrobiopterin dehydratase